MPIVTQEPAVAVVKIGGDDVDLSSFTLIQLQSLLKDVQAMMRLNNDLLKAGKRDVTTAIRVESVYVGLNRFVQEWMVYRQQAGATPTEPPVALPTQETHPYVA